MDSCGNVGLRQYVVQIELWRHRDADFNVSVFEHAESRGQPAENFRIDLAAIIRWGGIPGHELLKPFIEATGIRKASSRRKVVSQKPAVWSQNASCLRKEAVNIH